MLTHRNLKQQTRQYSAVNVNGDMVSTRVPPGVHKEMLVLLRWKSLSLHYDVRTPISTLLAVSLVALIGL